jgi:hypothetical protein
MYHKEAPASSLRQFYIYKNFSDNMGAFPARGRNSGFPLQSRPHGRAAILRSKIATSPLRAQGLIKSRESGTEKS